VVRAVRFPVARMHLMVERVVRRRGAGRLQMHIGGPINWLPF
jgi:hypothetical protein